MAVAPPSTYHSHLDPGDLRLRLTSISSYGRKYQSTADPTYNHKDKSGDHVTRSGSCYRRDSSVKDSTNSSPAQAAEAETLRRSIHRKRKPGFPTLEIDNLDESVKYTAFLQGLRPTSKFAFSVNKSPPAIEALIKRGQLRKFVAPGEGRQQTPPATEEREDREENVGTINTISGGIAVGGPSGKARKAYAREVYVTSPPPNKKLKTVPAAKITFSGDDSDGIKTPHDDPLVITIKAGNFDVKRVLIDNGSSAEILFHDAFKKMNIPTDRLRNMDTSLYGFSNHPVTAEGIIALPVAIGTPPAQANFMVDFVVVKVPSTYNAILGRPTLNMLQAVVSTYHLKMKFPTEHRIGEVKRDQTTARQCYVTSCQSKNKEALIIEDLREDTKMQRGEPVEDLVSIEVYPREENKTVRIGSNLKENTKLELVNLLRTYADIFAWTAADMPGIDPEIITHRLNKSFEELKAHLSSPPLLSKPFPGEDLLIYLSVTEVAVSTVLIREEDGVQKPIYYVSKVLQDVETRYLKIDKIALALIISARRLRPYFQSHTIVVLTDQPLRKVLMSPEASGRLVNWSVESGEFDLQYKPRTAVKAQALEDFIVECTLPEDPPQLVISKVTDPWNLYVHCSSAVGNTGAKIILIRPFPMASGQRRVVIVAIDYFTKWTEAESLAAITSAKCEDFFWKNIVCHFGVPRALVVDNGKQFDNNNFRTF
ncbi:hypothetical protein RJ639_018209 [Escallonia herrerae]|uniref:Integrase catalytic domain-containing protein n=1 Tax=Escallonia herrerae TaxID=1293975 RepID=A0AA89AH41_9ASTE|nr:hypothetical protein RJ639_018209 [Escallonia herrerae]